MSTYTPIAKSKLDFKLSEPTRENEERIHKLQVRFRGLTIEERMHICDYEGWRYEDKIPEYSMEPRVAISALNLLLQRSAPVGENVDLLRESLKKLIDTHSKQPEPVEAVHPTEYWSELASIIFVQFRCEDPSQINFKVVEQARKDFFE